MDDHENYEDLYVPERDNFPQEITTKVVHMKRFDFFLAEAFCNGKYLAFTQGKSQKEAVEKLRDKLENYYHITNIQNGKRLYLNRP